MKYSFTIIFLLFISFRAFSQGPVFEWANQCGNPPNTTDTKTTLASAPDGGFYISGEFLDTASFGDKTLISSGGTDIFLVKQTADGSPVWTSRIGAADYDYVQKIKADPDGNVVMTGYFYGLTQIGQDQYTSYGSQDLFIAKLNAGGAVSWSTRIGGPMADYITGLSLDQERNIVITGYFYDELSFGDTTIYATSSSDAFTAKYNPEGNLLWVASAGGSSSDQERSVSCDGDNNIYVTGSFYYDVTLGDTMLSTADPVGVFIARYLPGGQLDRVFQLNGSYLSTENYIVTGQSGDFFISGNFSGEMLFGDETFEAGEFNQDIYIARYDLSCDLQWARHAFSASSDQIIGIETDQADNLFLAGHYLDTIQFDGLVMPYTLCCGSRQIFIVNYDSYGNVAWGDSITGTRASVQSLVVNEDGKLALSGLFTEDIRMGPFKLSSFNGFQNYVTCMATGGLNSLFPPGKTTTLKIYPNPAKDYIRVSLDFNNDLTDYRILSINGHCIISGVIGSDHAIDISFLPAGIYILQSLHQEQGTSFSSFFVKE